MKTINDLHFGENEKAWQYQRRGRYVEFNLVLDKGTKCGLDTNCHIESIFMSLPPQAHWAYNYQVQPRSKEKKTLEWLKKRVDWVQDLFSPFSFTIKD